MIKAGMTVAEAILQLTRGFRKIMGRNPDGLEKIKIQQEAIQRLKELEKVVDMQGRFLDPSKTIMGGTQEGAALRSGIMKATNSKPKPVTSLDDPIKRVYESEKKAGKFENIRLKDGRKIESEEDFREYIDELNEDSNFATGGRAGFKSGLGKRFLEILKGKPKKMFRSKDDVPTFEKKGPMTIEDMENIPLDELIKIKRTQELGLYDETPEILKAGNLFDRFTKKVGDKRVIDYDRAEIILNRKLRGDETLNELLQIEYQTRPGRAGGGIMRLGLKDGSGMTRRTFLKFLAGAASIPIVGKFLKPMKIGKTVTKVPMIKTDNVAGKPEWFDSLVNKVILEGDDVTKKFATGERQSIHQKTLDDGSVVRVTEDVDQGAVRVEYDSDANVFEDTVQMEYKKPLPDESDPRPTAEFTTAESGPVGRQSSPDDFDIDIDEVGGSSIEDLSSDVSKLKEFATGKGPTMREIIQNKRRKDKAKAITEDPEAQMDALIRRQGEALDYDDYASGGIARMLGE